MPAITDTDIMSTTNIMSIMGMGNITIIMKKGA